MEHILEPTPLFDFNKLTFISPTSLNGGIYFIRILTEKQQPLYIQTPKCNTKQGILKSGKKMLCDLVFKHEDETFLEFLESLESFCQKQIYENREKWFESGLSMVDIENCFVSPTKSFKSGKMHVMRTNVPIRLGKCSLKIFDEQEQDVQMENLKENTSVVSIMEIQGIRCSARSFQIEFELKQMMVLKPMEDIFEKCMLAKPLVKKNDVPIVASPAVTNKPDIVIKPNPDYEMKGSENNSGDGDDNNDKNEDEDEVVVEDEDEDKDKDDTFEKVKEEDPNILETKTADKNENDEKKEEEFDLMTEKEVLNNLEETNSKEEPLEDSDLHEITLDVPKEEETIKLKNPNEVYFEMYKEAKKKAQIARDLAISSYLSAKQIKHNYLSDEVFSDDEEMANEEQELKELDLNEETN